MKSWKTTATGVVTILAAVLNAASAFLDNDPLTVPDWNGVVIAISAGIGLLFARDNKVTSEDAGAK